MVEKDRGQLLLAGSITIALVFIGLTVLLNSVIYTENVSGGSAVEVTGDINEFNKEARRNSRGLTIRINHATSYSSSSEIGASLDDNFSVYSDRLSESFADTGSVYVNVSFDGIRQTGRRVVQTDDAGFQLDGNPDWEAFDSDMKTGWFVLNLNASTVSRSTPLILKVDGSSGSTLTIKIKQIAGSKLQVNSSIGGSHTSSVTCHPSGGRVLLDIIDGTAHTGDCSFNATSFIEPPYQDIRIRNGDAATGKLSFVVNGSASDLSSDIESCSSGSPTSPCHMPAAWEIEVTTRYSSTEVAYENTQHITVYESA